jgi:hypothetical protein
VCHALIVRGDAPEAGERFGPGPDTGRARLLAAKHEAVPRTFSLGFGADKKAEAAGEATRIVDLVVGEAGFPVHHLGERIGGPLVGERREADVLVVVTLGSDVVEALARVDIPALAGQRLVGQGKRPGGFAGIPTGSGLSSSRR